MTGALVSGSQSAGKMEASQILRRETGVTSKTGGEKWWEAAGKMVETGNKRGKLNEDSRQSDFHKCAFSHVPAQGVVGRRTEVTNRAQHYRWFVAGASRQVGMPIRELHHELQVSYAFVNF